MFDEIWGKIGRQPMSGRLSHAGQFFAVSGAAALCVLAFAPPGVAITAPVTTPVAPAASSAAGVVATRATSAVQQASSAAAPTAGAPAEAPTLPVSQDAVVSKPAATAPTGGDTGAAVSNAVASAAQTVSSTTAAPVAAVSKTASTIGDAVASTTKTVGSATAAPVATVTETASTVVRRLTGTTREVIASTGNAVATTVGDRAERPRSFSPTPTNRFSGQAMLGEATQPRPLATNPSPLAGLPPESRLSQDEPLLSKRHAAPGGFAPDGSATLRASGKASLLALGAAALHIGPSAGSTNAYPSHEARAASFVGPPQRPSGLASITGAATGASASIFFLLTGLLLFAGSQTRSLSLASERPPLAPLVSIPVPPG
jgi:trimeric autotransporter adhesin